MRTSADAVPIAAVLFDLDDTLFLQRTWLEGTWAAVAGRDRGPWGRSSDCHRIAAVRGIAGQRRRTDHRSGPGADRLWRSAGPPLVAVFRSHAPAVLPLVPGAAAALRRMSATRPIALVTDGDPEIQRAKLRALGIDDMFSAIIFSDEFGRERRKPDSAPFAAALEALGVMPRFAVYVGDHPTRTSVEPRERACAASGCTRVSTQIWRMSRRLGGAWARSSTRSSCSRASAASSRSVGFVELSAGGRTDGGR